MGDQERSEVLLLLRWLREEQTATRHDIVQRIEVLRRETCDRFTGLEERVDGLEAMHDRAYWPRRLGMALSVGVATALGSGIFGATLVRILSS